MTDAIGKKSEHTRTPWKVFTSPDGLKLVGIGAENGEGVCDAGFGIWAWKDAEGIANAELIVRAVNSHDDLLAAATEAFQHIPFHAADCEGVTEYEEGAIFDNTKGCTCFLSRLRAAIAKARAVSTQEGQRD